MRTTFVKETQEGLSAAMAAGREGRSGRQSVVVQTAACDKALRRPVWPMAGAAETWSGPILGSQGGAKEVKRELTPRSGPGDGMRGPFINVRTWGRTGVGQGWEREGSLKKKGEAER